MNQSKASAAALPAAITTLIIAEKPSVMRVIAKAAGGPDRGMGFIACPGGVVVTHCVGHLLELCPPEHYSADGRSRPSWPLFPHHYDKEAKKETKKQLALIGKLLKVAKSAVNAGDPDREGQYLVDEVLQWHKYKGPVRRYLSAAMDERSVKQALDSLQDNAAHASLGQAAYARAVADWLVGMNLSNLIAPAVGHRLAMGRVQTPTLSFIGERCGRIEHFVCQTYYGAAARFQTARGEEYEARLELPREYLNAEGYVTDDTRLSALIAQLQGRSGIITACERHRQITPPPPGHTLTSLQQEASRRHRLSAQKTLTAAQSLYEKKLISYPRSACAHLPCAQRSDVPAVLANIARACPEFSQIAGLADPGRPGTLFNDEKVCEEAHTAIVPTVQDVSTADMQAALRELSGDERTVYTLICRRYLACFLPDHAAVTLCVTTGVDGFVFTSRARQVVTAGWKMLDPGRQRHEGLEEDEHAEEDDRGQELPGTLEKGLRCEIRSLQLTSGKTRPPAYFTDATLLEAMEHPGRYVEDEQERAVLREIGGIGTPATRAAIIESLRAHEYVTVRGGRYLITELGRTVLQCAPARLRSPALTAQTEQQLTLIARGQLRTEHFIAAQVRQIQEEYMPDLEHAQSSCPTCPKCGRGRLFHNPPAEKNGRSFRANYHCGNKECGAYFDVNEDGSLGAERQKAPPGEQCPACGAATCRRYPDKFHEGQHRWWCSSCKSAFADDDGRIGAQKTASGRQDAAAPQQEGQA